MRRTWREVQRARQRHRGVAYDTHPIPTVTATTVVVAAVAGVVVAGVNIAVVVDVTAERKKERKREREREMCACLCVGVPWCLISLQIYTCFFLFFIYVKVENAAHDNDE